MKALAICNCRRLLRWNWAANPLLKWSWAVHGAALFLVAALASQLALASQVTDTNTVISVNPTILLIGDSHSVMAFGKTLARRLGANRYAVSSTTASDWLKPRICPEGKPCEFIYGFSTPNGDFNSPVPPDFAGIEGLLTKTSATQVVIALGTNDADQRCHLPANAGMAAVKELMERIGNRNCFWIGPPTYERGPVFKECGKSYDTFISRLKTVVQSHGCQFVDSRKFLDPQTLKPVQADLDDDLHFSERLGHIWGNAAADEILKTQLALAL